MEVEVQTPPKENGKPKNDELSPKLIEVSETNGKTAVDDLQKPAKIEVEEEKIKTKSPEPARRSRRSRSKTPTTQKKNKQKKAPKEKEPEVIIEDKKENGDDAANVEVVEPVNGNNEEQLKEAEVKNSVPAEPAAPTETAASSPEPIDMEPLILNADEPDPELEFDENSDKESGKSSPIISRCMTRRSQNRNIPTPKTPKPSEEKKSDLDHTYDSIDLNLSTKVEVGSDATRLNFELEDSIGDQYLQNCRNRSLRGLSSRRSIRPSHDDYLKRAIKNNQDSAGGVKRKHLSETPEEERKRMRVESPGILSRLSSPLASFRYRFRAEATSSTPKLTGYKDKSNGLSCTENQIEVENNVDDKKSWCTVM